MNKYKFTTTSLLAALSIASCSTTPSINTLDKKYEETGEVVNSLELIGETGVTFVSTDGAWFNYLGADGRKVVKINESGLIKELTWRVNNDGQFCQQMFRTEQEECDNLVLIKDDEGIFNSYNKKDNKPGSPFTVVSGNPENL